MLPELIWEWINTGKTYIFMGLIRHDELTRLFRDLEWNFSEFGEAGFTWHGRNSYGFNRLFLIREGEGSLMNHSAGESLRLEPVSCLRSLISSSIFRPDSAFSVFISGSK